MTAIDTLVLLDPDTPDYVKEVGGVGHLTLGQAIREADLDLFTPNLPMLRRVLAIIEELDKVDTERGEGSRWDQSTWFNPVIKLPDGAKMAAFELTDEDVARGEVCGTAACFCGWALADANVAVRYGKYLVTHPTKTLNGAPEWGVDFEMAGQRLLNLPSEVAMDLFDGSNDLDDIKEVLDSAMGTMGYIDWRHSDKRLVDAPSLREIWEEQDW